VICTSLSFAHMENLRRNLKGLNFAEIRLEALCPTPNDCDLKQLFSFKKKLVATMRPGSHSDAIRKTALMSAITYGAAYVDIELESKLRYREDLISHAHDCGTKVIISFHDFEKTPPRKRLDKIVDDCFTCGADIAKIACMAHSQRDSARLLSLLDDDRQIIAIGMGDHGKITRISGPLLGSPFGYASLSSQNKTAPGQLGYVELKLMLQQVSKND